MESRFKIPEVDQWWEADFAFLHIIAKRGDYVWVSLIPKNSDLHDSLRTMSVHSFNDYKLLENS